MMPIEMQMIRMVDPQMPTCLLTVSMVSLCQSFVLKINLSRVGALTADVQLQQSTGYVVTANEYPRPVYDQQKYPGYVDSHCPPLHDLAQQILVDCNCDCIPGSADCAMLEPGHSISDFLQNELRAACSDGETSGGWKDKMRPKVSPRFRGRHN